MQKENKRTKIQNGVKYQRIRALGLERSAYLFRKGSEPLVGIVPWFMAAGLMVGATDAMLSESMGICLHSATSWGKRNLVT